MGAIALESVTKRYSGSSFPALDDVTLTIADGEFLVLVGPSGCGKSTLLRAIAGLEQLDGGSVRIDGREMAGVPPQRRDVAMVFQNYALYPHMTVRENLGYGLKVARVRKEEAGRRIDGVARLLGLEELLERKPGALSGGQRQRTAMGRAIVREPAAFLMDEPLSNVDAKLRVSMRASLAELHSRLTTTTVYVTHDQIEAMTLGQRVAVMHQGRLQQVDTPRALYDAPANLVVASFIGSPPMNLVQARLREDAVEFGTYSISLAQNERPTTERAQEVVLGMRPEDLSPTAPGDAAFGEAEVILVEEHGADAHVVLALDAPGFHADPNATAADTDNELLGDGRARFIARVDPRTRLRQGGRIALAIDPARLHFFDGATGRRLPKRS